MKKNATLKDIAKRVGVSSSTVSRALNPETKKLINRDLVKRIVDVALELDYTANLIAKSLKNGKTYTIGIIVPDVVNPIFGEMLDGMIEQLSLLDYKSIIILSNENNLDFINTFSTKQVDGLIFANAFINDAGVEYCVNNEIPCVTVGRSTESNNVNQVCVDNESGIGLAISHLRYLGHQNIAFISGPKTISDGYERDSAYRYWKRYYNLDPNDELTIITNSFTQDEGYTGIKKLFEMERKFSAVVTGSDLLAIGVLSYFKHHDIRCPQDISVVGFNGMIYSDVLLTPLTTITVNRKIMAKLAVNALMNSVRNINIEPEKHLIKPELIVRESTSVPRRFSMF
ncbi:LacI family DNA-binding transcriptional regulator [Vibrio crassostreae]|uniref:LacI family DNA-binding transcriptional regulator n=1 Tax=Vibrio crassostreae TaxID=246167 RepID=UPI001B304D44|nr:LacI family DNA-binding transcriptional regulator [Vibrio crassostreae]